MDTQNKDKKTVKVGIIQMQSWPLEIDRNLSHAGQFIEKVCSDGAQLVVLPELFSVGYTYDEESMKYSENRVNGITVSWLKEQASKYGAHILTSIYELDGNDYFNTMVMVEPNGNIQYYRKRNPFWQECALFQQGEQAGPGIFDTELGRIGGIICFDAFSKEAYQNLKNNQVDMIAIVACWGAPRLIPEYPDLKYPKKMLEEFAHLATEVIPGCYARGLSVPVIHVGQGGISSSPVPVPKYWPFSKPMQQCDGDFWGHSQIRDANGAKLVEADKAEFTAVVSIEVNEVEDHAKIERTKVTASYLSSNQYIVQPPSFMSKVTQQWCHIGFNEEYNSRRINRD